MTRIVPTCDLSRIPHPETFSPIPAYIMQVDLIDLAFGNVAVADTC